MTRLIVLGFLLVPCIEIRAQTPDSVHNLIIQLKSKKAETRGAALNALAELGPKAAPAIPVVVDFLTGFDEEERILATFALGSIGKASLPAVDKLLDHQDETTRYYAVWAFALIGEGASTQAPRLLKMLHKDDDEDVRIKTAHALARIAPNSRDVLDTLAKLAKSKNTHKPVRLAAIEELRHFGKDALAPLHYLFPDEEVSWYAIDSFNHLLNENKKDAFAQAAWPHVAEILIDPYLYASFDFPGDGLIFVLSAHGENLLPSLVKMLTDKNLRTRKRAVWALGQMAANLTTAKTNPELVKKAIKLLLPHFQSPDVDVRRIVASIAPWHPDTEKAFEGLMLDEVFQDAKWNVSHQGGDLIGRWMKGYEAAKLDEKLRLAFAFEAREHDKDVLDLVWANVKHKDPAMRHRIACWLAKEWRRNDAKAGKLIVPILLDSLKSKNADHRLQAVNALQSIQSAALATIDSDPLGDLTPTILDRLDDPSPEVRLALLHLLHPRTEADTKRTLKLMAPLLEHPEADVRWAVVSVLAFLGKQGVALLAKVVQEETDANVLEHTCDWLALRREDAEAAVPALLKRAEQEEFWPVASYALFAIAPDRSFPGLLAILKKRDEALRRTVIYPSAVHDNPAKLVEALLDDWKKSDLRQSQAIVHTLLRIQPLLSEEHHNTLVYRTAPLVSEHLDKVQKVLTSKRAEDRRDAVVMLPFLKKMRALQPTKYLEDWKKRLEFQSSAEQQIARMDDLLLKACADEDLQVRRLARKAYSAKVQPVLPGGYAQPFRFKEWWPQPSPRQEFAPRVVAWA